MSKWRMGLYRCTLTNVLWNIYIAEYLYVFIMPGMKESEEKSLFHEQINPDYRLCHRKHYFGWKAGAFESNRNVRWRMNHR